MASRATTAFPRERDGSGKVSRSNSSLPEDITSQQPDPVNADETTGSRQNSGTVKSVPNTPSASNNTHNTTLNQSTTSASTRPFSVAPAATKKRQVSFPSREPSIFEESKQDKDEYGFSDSRYANGSSPTRKNSLQNQNGTSSRRQSLGHSPTGYSKVHGGQSQSRRNSLWNDSRRSSLQQGYGIDSNSSTRSNTANYDQRRASDHPQQEDIDALFAEKMDKLNSGGGTQRS